VKTKHTVLLVVAILRQRLKIQGAKMKHTVLLVVAILRQGPRSQDEAHCIAGGGHNQT
jgi:hypothetical protein